MLFVDDDGVIDAERIVVKRFSAIERGKMAKINGIIVHQTNSLTAQSTFNSYNQTSANGAHFLIDKDGKIYQTASLFKVTWHVGLMQSRCFLKKKCKPTEVNLLALHTKSYWKRKISKQIYDIEKVKDFPDRFPGNTDSIGIEIVGQAVAVKGKAEPVYETVNDKQNDSLRWLISELASTFKVPMTEIYRHPDVGRKNETEASTAEWK